MSDDDLAAYAFLWDGSEPEWYIVQTHTHERRITVVFDASGPTPREVAALRTIFDELRDRSAQELWSGFKGKARIRIEEVFSAMTAPRLVAAARKSGLTIEVDGTSHVHRLPMNKKTNHALVVEDDALAERITQRMLDAGVDVQHVEVD